MSVGRVARILNESAIDSATLNPVIRRQLHQHVGRRDREDLIVRVFNGRSKCTKVSGRASRARHVISIEIPPRLIVSDEDWRRQAPRLAQVVAILAARFSGRHSQLQQREKFKSSTPEAVDEFAAAAEIPFALRGYWPTLAMEARLEYIVLQRRAAQQVYESARRRYQRYRNWEKQLRHRLRKVGSQV